MEKVMLKKNCEMCFENFVDLVEYNISRNNHIT